MCDAVYHTMNKIEEVEIDDDIEEELPKEPILLYYINYDAMIEAITNFPNSEYFQTCEINNETVWKLAGFKKNMCLKHLKPIWLKLITMKTVNNTIIFIKIKILKHIQ